MTDSQTEKPLDIERIIRALRVYEKNFAKEDALSGLAGWIEEAADRLEVQQAELDAARKEADELVEALRKSINAVRKNSGSSNASHEAAYQHGINQALAAVSEYEQRRKGEG